MYLCVPSDSPKNADYDNETDSEPETSDSEESCEDPPDQQPEISLKLTRKKFWKGFKLGTGSTATSPSGHHLGHYKVLI